MAKPNQELLLAEDDNRYVMFNSRPRRVENVQKRYGFFLALRRSRSF